MIRGISIKNGIKSAAAKRFVSTANGQTKYATLSNGVTVATEANPHAKSSTIGVWFAAGSRSEHPYSNGISALTANVLGSGLKDGILLSSDNTRETNGIFAQTTNDNIGEAGKLISTIASNASDLVESSDFEASKKQLIKQAQQLESIPSKMIDSHLNATAYQGYSLGLPVLGTAESIKDLQVQDSQRLLEKHMVGSNVVIAASGNFNHDELVNAIESSVKIPAGHKPAVKPASFLGSEVRMRDDTLPKAYITLAAEGEGVSSPAYYVAKVASAIFGNFDHNSPIINYTSPKLASIVQEYHIVDKYTHFSNSYSDTGLWGFNAEISNVTLIDDFLHFTLKEWNRLSISISDAEVARAKQQIKTQLLVNLGSSNAITSDIANSVLLTGYRNSIKEALEKVDQIKTKDVKAWAQATLWDKDIAISGTGQIEGLMDYNRWRNNMSMMRW